MISSGSYYQGNQYEMSDVIKLEKLIQSYWNWNTILFLSFPSDTPGLGEKENEGISLKKGGNKKIDFTKQLSPTAAFERCMSCMHKLNIL